MAKENATADLFPVAPFLVSQKKLDMPQFELQFQSFPSYHEDFPYALEAKTVSQTGACPAFLL